MPSLSNRQRQILTFVQNYHDEHRFMPSVREIQDACSLSSTSVVDYNLRILAREGHIRRSPDISRGLELVDAPRNMQVDVFSVPLLGSIAAGQPIPVPLTESWRNVDEYVQLPPNMAVRGPQQVFALRVRGYSMIDALIDDGDLIVLRHGGDVHQGDLVAAWVVPQEEATLKRFYREGNNVRLQPANAQFAPIILPAIDVEIHGTVIAVIRHLD